MSYLNMFLTMFASVTMCALMREMCLDELEKMCKVFRNACLSSLRFILIGVNTTLREILV